MGSRRRSIRFKIFFLLLLPLLMLSGMWGFVLKVTATDALLLQRSTRLYYSLGVTANQLIAQLQQERSIAARALSSPQISRVAFSDQQVKTNAALTRFRQTAGSEEIRELGGDSLRAAITPLFASLEALPALRELVRTGKITRLQAINRYGALAEKVYDLEDKLIYIPELSVFRQVMALHGLGSGTEMASREDALIRGAIISGKLAEDEYRAFAEWAANRRYLHRLHLAGLSEQARQPYEKVMGSPAYSTLVTLENIITQQAPRSDGSLPAQVHGWPAATEKVKPELDASAAATAAVLTTAVSDLQSGLVTRMAISASVGLVVIIALVSFSVRFGRRLARDLAGLRDAALDLANTRLPRVVDKLAHNEQVDVDAEAPPIDASGSTEIEDVAQAFTTVQRTAIQSAVGQATLRQSVNQVFRNLARRNQTLMHRHLALLDKLQSRTQDPEILEDLYRLDHLTTRMRRHAESLIILSGARPGRSRRGPVPVLDVVRAAIAEIEDYTRISVAPMPDSGISGESVTDVVHLIAELLDNATSYSPSTTKIQVQGDLVANGFVLEIEDRGMGLTPEEYEEINKKLANPPAELDLTSTEKLGLLVVGRLAARHGISVQLRSSPYAGTTVIVLIPNSLVSATMPYPLAGADSRGAGGGAHARPAHARQLSASSASMTDRQGPETPDSGEPTLLFTPTTRRTQAIGHATSDPQPAAERDFAPAAARDLSVVSDPSLAAVDRTGPHGGLPSWATAMSARDAFGVRRNGDGSDGSHDNVVRDGAFRDRGFRDSASRDYPSRDDSPSRDNASRDSASRGNASHDSGGSTRDAEQAGQPASSPPSSQRIRTSIVSGTHAGLPRRVRQANLAPQLRRTPPLSAPPPPPQERSPEEARATFSAIQRGMRRGREEFEQSSSGTSGPHAHNRYGGKDDE